MKRKKTIRNILIAVIAALVIAGAIFLTIILQKDGAGMNCFRRNATAATADGERASMAEYRVAFDTVASNYQSTQMTNEQIRNLQEYAAREALMQKVYIKEAKSLGLTLSDDQKASCRQNAQSQVDSIEAYYAESLANSGNYSKAALDKQVNAYYQNLGMSKNEYRSFLTESAEAELCRQAIEAYYKQNGSGIAEDELVAFYRRNVAESMTTKNADGTESPVYSEGMFWNYMMLYSIGYASPMLYVPEGFIYIDFIQMEAASEEEAAEIVGKFNMGEMSFDELLNSEDNKDPFRALLKAPYPIAENDHSALFTPQEIYTMAAELPIGGISSYIGKSEPAEDGTVTATVYLFRRAEGDMCYDGDHGVIKIDYFEGIRESAEEQFRVDRWLGDIRYEDAIYTYKGAIG